MEEIKKLIETKRGNYNYLITEKSAAVLVAIDYGIRYEKTDVICSFCNMKNIPQAKYCVECGLILQID